MSTNLEKKTNFQDLLKSLADVSAETETLAKAAPAAKADADDTVVQEAAADGGAVDKNTDEDELNEADAEFGKSLGLTPEGEKLVDATDLVKSLIGRQDSSEDVLAKALQTFTGVLGKQNALIKSLQGQVATLGTQGRGRKTLLSIVERPSIDDTAMAKSQAAENAVTPDDLLAKANAAHGAGKLSGQELNTVDVCLRNRWPIDAGLLRKVASV